MAIGVLPLLEKRSTPKRSYRRGARAAKVTKEDQAAVGIWRAGPSLTLESRIPMWVARSATSTQLLPVPSLYEDLNQAASTHSFPVPSL